MINGHSAGLLEKWGLDVRSGRRDTAILISIACGFVIFAVALLLFAIEYSFPAFFGLNATDFENNDTDDLRRVSHLLGMVIIGPILETTGVVWIYHFLVESFKFHRVVFVLINTIGFTLLHDYPINAGVAFSLFSVQYLFMRSYYGKRAAFWSIATSHGMNNALTVVLSLFFWG